MKLFVTSVVLGLASISIAQGIPAGLEPTEIAPQGCPSPTCYHKYCPDFHAGTEGNAFCKIAPATGNSPGPTVTPKVPASSQATATATPKSPAESGTAKDTGASTGATSSPSAQQSSGTTGGATGADSSPSASATGNPNAGDRSMTISGGLWTVAIAAFAAIVYRL
ncbi:hypothetical protein MMC07_005621 [Pseudocyphellaria aurata]|nr:hypothetical protein [Pseudocyphellaria aurata]